MGYVLQFGEISQKEYIIILPKAHTLQRQWHKNTHVSYQWHLFWSSYGMKTHFLPMAYVVKQ